MGEAQDISLYHSAVEAAGVDPIWRVLMGTKMVVPPVKVGVVYRAQAGAVGNFESCGSEVHDKG